MGWVVGCEKGEWEGNGITSCGRVKYVSMSVSTVGLLCISFGLQQEVNVLQCVAMYPKCCVAMCPYALPIHK